MATCSVCDARFPDDLRECPVCGAPSTAVMGALDHEDAEWERLAGDYAPADGQPAAGGATRAFGDDAAPRRATADDPEWAALAERLGPLDQPSAAERARLRAGGLLRRLRRRSS